MTLPPKDVLDYHGKLDEDTGVSSITGYSSYPYHYEHVDEHRKSDEEVYRVECYLHLSESPIHRNVYFVPAEYLDEFFSHYAETGEIVEDIRPTTWEEAEEELAGYSGNF